MYLDSGKNANFSTIELITMCETHNILAERL